METPKPTPLSRLRSRLKALRSANSFLPGAAFIGLIGALATVVFREGLGALQALFFDRSGSFTEIAASLPWQMRLLTPCLGGLLAGALLSLSRRLGTSAKPNYMEVFALGDGRVPVRTTLLNALSSLFSIAAGGSIGREGSMIQLAALSASLAGRAARITPMRLRLVVACGAAAGIAAAYNAPIASAFFVTEIVLGVIAMDSLGPIMVASVVANITMRHLPGYHPTYEMPAFSSIASLEVLAFVALGVLAGLVAPAFLTALDRSKRAFNALALPVPLRLALGGLGVGMISIGVPQVWGNGYSVVNSLLHHHWLWQTVLLVLVCKISATLLTCGSGAVGGIFTPTIFVGATVGYLFATAMGILWPDAGALPSAYVAVGMGATLAAATSAPLMAILMIFEMTLSYQLMLPLMLACVVAYAVARAAGGRSMYDITARHQAMAEERERLRHTRAEALIQAAETVLHETAPLALAADMFRQHPVKYVYLVDDAHRYRGVVSVHDIASMGGEEALSTRRCMELIRRDALPLVTAGMSLDEALRQFMKHHGERLPVVRSLDDCVLLGAVRKTDVLDAYARLNRVSFDMS